MSARDLKPEDKPKYLIFFARVYARNLACHASMPPCEHGHPECAAVWQGTCGAEVIGAYDRFIYRGHLVEIRWTLAGWQHNINGETWESDWDGPSFDSKREAESDAGERIDLAQS